MTRTAADVQDEIDALEAVDAACIKAAVDTSAGIDEALGFHLETLKKTEPLKAERDRLEREELDAGTEVTTRRLAVALRQVYADAGGRGLEAPWKGMTWQSLSTEQARAWAAVARVARP